MKKLTKSLSLIGLATLLLSSTALYGCSPDNTSTPVELPKVEYTVDEAVMEQYSDPNDDVFSPENVTMKENSPLKGKTIYWLGSSVTYGSASNQDSMADYLAAMTGCISKKEAVSGTTLYDDGGTGDSGAKSYTRRLTTTTVFDKNEKIDAFVCQISTNDARTDRLSKWGEITGVDVLNKEAFDRGTTLGGVEYIIAYVTETWNCPVYFYSGSRFDDEGTRKNTNPKGSDYGKLVEEVKKVAEKWNSWQDYEVGVIDLYNDEDFNAQVSDTYYKWCTSDPIHPRRAGYLNWWTPYFENYLVINLTMKDYV